MLIYILINKLLSTISANSGTIPPYQHYQMNLGYPHAIVINV